MRCWWKSHTIFVFTENLNGPYGPYEPLLWDISPNKWPEHCFFWRTHCFWKHDHVQNVGNCYFWVSKKNCGVPRQQSKGRKQIAEHYRPISDQIISKHVDLYIEFNENQELTIKSKTINKIVAKAKLRKAKLRELLFAPQNKHSVSAWHWVSSLQFFSQLPSFAAATFFWPQLPGKAPTAPKKMNSFPGGCPPQTPPL